MKAEYNLLLLIGVDFISWAGFTSSHLDTRARAIVDSHFQVSLPDDSNTESDSQHLDLCQRHFCIFLPMKLTFVVLIKYAYILQFVAQIVPCLIRNLLMNCKREKKSSIHSLISTRAKQTHILWLVGRICYHPISNPIISQGIKFKLLRKNRC